MSMGDGSAFDAVADLRSAAGDDAVKAKLDYLQSIADATKAGVEGALRKIDRAEFDLQAAHEAHEQAEENHTKAVDELTGFKTAAGVE